MSLNPNKYPEDNPLLVKQNNTTYKFTLLTRYKIPDDYIVQTSWGRGKSKHIIECEIKYELDGPIFIVRFQEDSQQYILELKESPSNVANKYLWKKNPDNPSTRISGIHVFCLNILDIEKEHERKHRSSSFRPFNTLSESMKTKRFRAFSVQLDKAFKNEVPNFFNPKKTSSFDAFVKVIDQGPISRDAYRKLAALQPELPRDHNISNARKNINEKMNKQ
ncbi:29190_t:CDS:2, partial [Gigaspora margarita]